MNMLYHRIAKYVTDVKKAIKIIYAASPKHFVQYLIISVLLVVISYLPIRLWRYVLNALTDYISGSEHALIRHIGLFVIAYCVVHLLQSLLNATIRKVSYQYNDELAYYIDNVLVDKISEVELSFFDSSKLADNLLNTTKYMSFTLQRIVLLVFELLNGVIRIALSICLICALDIHLALILVLLSIPTVFFDRRTKSEKYDFTKSHRNAQRKLDYYKGLLFDKARWEIKVYDLSRYLENKYCKEWEHYHKAQRLLHIKQCIRAILSLFLIRGAEIATYFFAVSQLLTQSIGVGEVSYYISISNKFRSDFTSMTGTVNEFRQLSTQLDDILEINQMQAEAARSGKRLPRNLPCIDFQNVSFRYPGSNQDVLKECSFTVHPGETVGLVGLNGAGKSTVVKLLLQFYQPTDGRILIDGIDAREYDLYELRRRFGVLFQGYCKYSFTLRENIALADISHLNSDQKIQRACALSKVTDFASEWKRGMDEPLTRRFEADGRELSGGQWQRVSLARAFFRDADFLLLDEPSAALDPVAEHEIFDRISQLSDQKSALLISHRLSSITLTDRILVLGDGHIIEQGTHTELMQLEGEYARLFRLQANKYQL